MRMRQLEAFRYTVLHGTMSEAATRLRTSQPTVSRLLSDLELDLGFPLLTRRKGKVVPTSEGMAFYEKLDEAFGAIIKLRGAASDIRRDRNKALRVISLPALSMTVIPEIFAQFLKNRPDMSVTLMTVDIPTYFNMIREGDADIAFGNQLGDQPEVEQITLAEVDFVCAIPPGHELARKAVVNAGDLVGHSVISLSEMNHGIFRRHDEVLGRYGNRIARRIFTQNSANGYAMVLKGLGIAILEPFSAGIWKKCGVEVRPFKPNLSYKYAVSFNRNAIRSDATKSLLQTARKIFAQYVRT